MEQLTTFEYNGVSICFFGEKHRLVVRWALRERIGTDG